VVGAAERQRAGPAERVALRRALDRIEEPGVVGIRVVRRPAERRVGDRAHGAPYFTRRTRAPTPASFCSIRS
jgi:hypothetical protein